MVENYKRQLSDPEKYDSQILEGFGSQTKKVPDLI